MWPSGGYKISRRNVSFVVELLDHLGSLTGKKPANAGKLPDLDLNRDLLVEDAKKDEIRIELD